MIATVHSPGLTFEPLTHTYRVDGREVPSVTQVLGDNRLRTDFSTVQPSILAYARQRGVAVHAATHYFDEGTLDPESVVPEIVPWLAAWRVFLYERRVTILEMERCYAHPRYGFAGMIDRVIGIHDGRRALTVLIDLKTGDPTDAAADLQTAAYAELYRAHAGRPVDARWSVQLHPERRVPYTVTAYRDPHDWSTFHAALRTTQARAARGFSWREAAA